MKIQLIVINNLAYRLNDAGALEVAISSSNDIHATQVERANFIPARNETWLGSKVETLLQEDMRGPAKPAWTLTRHLPGFRPLRDGESWHRQDFTEDMLAGSWRPLLLEELPVHGDEISTTWSGWRQMQGKALLTGAKSREPLQRTRRPLPEPAKVVPWDGPEDFPINCWLRHKQIPQIYYRPFSAEPLGVAIFYIQGTSLSWQVLADCYEHSFNCKTWLPCTKTIL